MEGKPGPVFAKGLSQILGIKGKAFVPGLKSPQITKITVLESLYTNINKHHNLLGYNISPFDSSDELFLPV